MQISITDAQVAKALGDFLTAVVPLGVEVFQGQQNRVPEPSNPDHIIFSPTRRDQLATTTHNYTMDTLEVGRSTSLDFQVDIYGPNSTDNAQIISTLFRDAWGCEWFADRQMQPLYCDDGQQMPLVNGEYQYEARWMIRITLQANPAISVQVQSADLVGVELVKADLTKAEIAGLIRSPIDGSYITDPRGAFAGQFVAQPVEEMS